MRDRSESMEKEESATRPALVMLAGVATFFGTTGILAALGFLVVQTRFLQLGFPYPPFSTSDYFRVAGIFLFDTIFVVIIFYGLYLASLALLVTAVGTAVVWLWRPRVRSIQALLSRYNALWARLAERRIMQRLRPHTATGFCVVYLLGLIAFTFYYHYPVFAQRYVTTAPEPCGLGKSVPWGTQTVWSLVDCHRLSIRDITLDRHRLHEAQMIYRNGVILLLLLMTGIWYHPYNHFRGAGSPHRGQRPKGFRWMWYPTALLLLLSVGYLPSGYAVLFLDKQAPLVHVTFKTEKDAKALPVAGGRHG